MFPSTVRFFQHPRALLCRASSNELGRFMGLWFKAALEAGRGQEFRPRRVFGACYTGVDLGHRKKIGADRTAMVTVCIQPDGRKVDFGGTRNGGNTARPPVGSTK